MRKCFYILIKISLKPSLLISIRHVLCLILFQNLGSLKEEEKDTVCPSSGVDSNGCLIDFIIFGRVTSNNTILLAIESDKMLHEDKCPKTPPLFEIGIGVASAMVLIGVLLLLIWKVVTHIQDKKEFAQFEKSINDASWNMVSFLIFHFLHSSN